MYNINDYIDTLNELLNEQRSFIINDNIWNATKLEMMHPAKLIIKLNALEYKFNKNQFDKFIIRIVERKSKSFVATVHAESRDVFDIMFEYFLPDYKQIEKILSCYDIHPANRIGGCSMNRLPTNRKLDGYCMNILMDKGCALDNHMYKKYFTRHRLTPVYSYKDDVDVSKLEKMCKYIYQEYDLYTIEQLDIIKNVVVNNNIVPSNICIISLINNLPHVRYCKPDFLKYIIEFFKIMFAFGAPKDKTYFDCILATPYGYVLELGKVFMKHIGENVDLLNYICKVYKCQNKQTFGHNYINYLLTDCKIVPNANSLKNVLNNIGTNKLISIVDKFTEYDIECDITVLQMAIACLDISRIKKIMNKYNLIPDAKCLVNVTIKRTYEFHCRSNPNHDEYQKNTEIIEMLMKTIDDRLNIT